VFFLCMYDERESKNEKCGHRSYRGT